MRLRSLRPLARVPILGTGLLTIYRTQRALRYGLSPAKNFFRWLVRSNEHTNFTYDLEAMNKRYLVAFVAQVTGQSRERMAGYMEELEQDRALRRHIDETIRRSAQRYFADEGMPYGRRLGWYAVARALKPKVIVETGVDKGLGACVLAAALLRNREEGAPGRYYGTDINPLAGYLLDGPYREVGEILYGDSIESLESLDETIDLFVNDSDHSDEYEAREYEVIRDKLSENAVLLGDNSHKTDKLLDFAWRTGREFLFFQEKPHRHWYPGGGIGAAFRVAPGRALEQAHGEPEPRRPAARRRPPLHSS